ncbi:MAG: YkgJ family cysteine cluster protein [Desulfotalea sp.]
MPIITDRDDPKTWIKYKAKLCSNCMGICCTLEVEVQGSDLVRMGLADEFEVEENPKKLAKRLKKEGVVEHYSPKNSLFTLQRMANDDCLYLDINTRKCTIYQVRPDTCRNHPHIGSRPGYCAFREK